MGSGVAIFDFNSDGRARPPVHQRPRLERADGAIPVPPCIDNDGNGKFTDVTAGSGLDIEMYGIGVSVADYDNDGRETYTSRRSKATVCSTTRGTESFAM